LFLPFFVRPNFTYLFIALLAFFFSVSSRLVALSKVLLSAHIALVSFFSFLSRHSHNFLFIFPVFFFLLSVPS